MEQNKQRIVVKVGTSTLTHNSARWTFGAWNIWCGPWRISRAWGMR